MPRSPRLPLRRRAALAARQVFGEPFCVLFGHGRPTLALVETRMRQSVPPGAPATRTLTTFEHGVVCARCATRVGD